MLWAVLSIVINNYMDDRMLELNTWPVWVCLKVEPLKHTERIGYQISNYIILLSGRNRLLVHMFRFPGLIPSSNLSLFLCLRIRNVTCDTHYF